MAEDIATLGIKVDSRQVKQADKDLDNLAKSGAKAEKETGKLSKTAKLAAVAIGAIATSAAVRQLQQYTDQFTSLNNQLRQLTNSEAQLTRTRKQLLAVSNDSRSNLDATVTLYARLTRATQDMNISHERRLALTDTINKSFIIEGASAEEAAGAIRQLSQGLAAGALRGDEFNSVAEQAPAIMQAIADHLRLTRGELREFAATGGITAQIVVDAMEKASDTIDTRFSSTVRTFGQSLEIANNNMTELAGSSNLLQGAMAGAGDMVVGLTEYLLELSAAMESTDSKMQKLIASINEQRTSLEQLTTAQVSESIRATFNQVWAIQAQIKELEKLQARQAKGSGNWKIYQGQIDSASEALAEHNQFLQELRERFIEATEDENLEHWIDVMTEGYKDLSGAVVSNTEAVRDNRQASHDLIQELQNELYALGLTGKELAIFEALQRLSSDATEEQKNRVRELVGAIWDQEQAMKAANDAQKRYGKEQEDIAKSMRREWLDTRDALADILVDIGNDFDNFADRLEKAALRGLAQWAVGGLMGGLPGAPGQTGGPFGGMIGGMASSMGLGKLAGGAASSLGWNATSGFWNAPSMMAGGGAGAGAGAGALGFLQAAAPWALGAFALNALVNKESTPSHNAGFLLEGLPHSQDRQFNVDPFASGLAPVGFNRRTSTGEAGQIVDLFRAVDKTAFDLLAGAGINLNTNRGTFNGLNEKGTGSGLFFGSAGEDGKPGMPVAQQLEIFLRQLLGSVADQLDPGDYEKIISASGIDNMLAALEDALKPAADQTTAAIDKLSDSTNNFSTLAMGMQDSIHDLMEVERNRILELGEIYQRQHDQRVKDELSLFNTQMALSMRLRDTANSLRLGDKSPLNPKSKLDLAQGLFRSTLQSAMGGDIDAAGRLSGAANQYAEASSGFFASSQGHKNIMEEILSGLDGASAAVAPKQSWDEILVDLDRELVAQMQMVNAQLATLPSSMAASLSPILTGFILQAQAGGTSNKVIANTIRNNGSAVSDIADESFNNFVSSNATPDDSIIGFVKAQRDKHGISRTALMNIRAKAVSLGISANYIGSLLGYGPAETQQALQAFGVPSFLGGGFTGHGPRVGGIDGMGGMPAIVHPNETIVDHARGGAANDALIFEVRALRDEVAELKRVEMAGWQHSGQQRERQIDAAERSGESPAVVGALSHGG